MDIRWRNDGELREKATATSDVAPNQVLGGTEPATPRHENIEHAARRSQTRGRSVGMNYEVAPPTVETSAQPGAVDTLGQLLAVLVMPANESTA